MPIYLDPTGRSTYGIGICARCSEKFFLEDLHPDPNNPGLRVCLADLDDYDPYRLPPRVSEDIALPFTRPDVPLDGDSDDATLFLIATENVNIVLVTENGQGLIATGVE